MHRLLKNILSYTLIISLSSIIIYAKDYTLHEGTRPKSRLDSLPKFQLQDRFTLPQRLSYYARNVESLTPLQQRKYNQKFDKAYFKPWHQTSLTINSKDFQWEVRFVRKKAIYTEDKKQIPPAVYERWIANAQYEKIDTKRYYAISVRHTDLKALPSNTPFYRNPNMVGEGFPFDYNQNSALYPNTPLYISHFSKDNRWAFVQAPYAFGWVMVRDIALIASRDRKLFENGRYGVAIRDNSRILSPQGTLHTRVKLGTLFPYAKNGKDLILAVRNPKGHAILRTLRITKKGLVAPKPLPFTPHNVAMIAKEFYDEPYGWGGNYFCRDCSAFTRDFFTPFGIFLHRNSSQQAKDGIQISIPKGNKQMRKRFIIRHAKAFRSLLYVPGHVVLYLGSYKDEPVVMHNYWGIRKNDGSKHITSRTIISTLEPGKEHSATKERSKLIHTLRTIVNF